eukprot:571670-Rhodomonas_salina.1
MVAPTAARQSSMPVTIDGARTAGIVRGWEWRGEREIRRSIKGGRDVQYGQPVSGRGRQRMRGTSGRLRRGARGMQGRRRNGRSRVRVQRERTGERTGEMMRSG